MTRDVLALSRQIISRTWRDARETPLMIELPGGEFMMGENEGDKFANDTERPTHGVRIPAGRALGCFPVTVGEFRRFRPDHDPNDESELPVVRVNWQDAQNYCHWLSEKTRRAYRLPSEAEWEYACRAGSAKAFACGDEITLAEANFLYEEHGMRIGLGHRTLVGNYPPNAFGVHDLHGNVCEWVEDTWHASYTGAPNDGLAWMEDRDSRHVVRGGAWDYLPRLLRSSWRDWRPAGHRADNLGFRVATNDLRNIPETP
jgi:formylglycine-generating enzyme required for sulfatase activity